MARVSILIVDDFEPWRRALRSILLEGPDLEVVGESSDGPEAVLKCGELQPDVVLLDIELPTMSGFEAAREIRRVSPDTKIVFVSTYRSLDTMREALKVGVGFVLKAEAARDLLPIIRSAMRDEPHIRFGFLSGEPSDSGST